MTCVHAADLSALTLRERLAQRRLQHGSRPASCAAAASAAPPSKSGEHWDSGEALWTDVLDAWRAYRRWAAVVVAAAERLAECANIMHLLCSCQREKLEKTVPVLRLTEVVAVLIDWGYCWQPLPAILEYTPCASALGDQIHELCFALSV